MEIEFDDAKDAINVANHGSSLLASMELLENDHDIRIDDRKKYGEDRMVATGHIGGRLHICVYTVRNDIIRVISLRRANPRETNAYRES
jgi:uncharacterized DUF497 family protein